MPLAASTGQFVEIDGVRTFFIQRGSGTPVLLLHGAPGSCSLDDWRANIEPLADAGFAVYAYDQPGFGYTDPPSDYSLEYRTQHAKRFVEAMGFDRYHLIGYSQGSYIAARLALEDPRVNRLILVSCGTVAGPGAEQGTASRATLNWGLGTWRTHSFDATEPATSRGATPSLESVREQTRRELFRRELATDDVVELRLEMTTGAHRDTMEKQRTAPRPRPVWEELKGLRPKTLVFWGLYDEGPAVERGLMLIEQLPDAELHVFAHSGHWVPYEEADRFNRLTVQFLSLA